MKLQHFYSLKGYLEIKLFSNKHFFYELRYLLANEWKKMCNEKLSDNGHEKGKYVVKKSLTDGWFE